MLLGNKKTQEEEQNWCLVLNPLQSEIDKKKVAAKISEVFSLSLDEASDLVSNTPIILLDNLARSVAAQVKDYFRSTGAEIFLTNDILLKRKCFRTVWPEPPKLSFLHEPDLPKAMNETEQMLEPEEAVHEIRSLNSKAASQQGSVVQELSHWKKECEHWRKKCEHQSQELEKLQKEINNARQRQALDASVREREKEIQKQKLLLVNAEERHEGLKEEYRQARALFEEKFAVASKEIQEWKKKFNDLASEKEKLEATRKNLEQALGERNQRWEESDKEFRHIRSLLDGKLTQAAQEIEEWKAKAEEMSKKIHVLDKEKVELEQRLQTQAEELAQGQRRYEEMVDRFDSLQSNQHQDNVLQENQEQRLRELEEANRSVEQALREQRQKHEDLREEYRKQKALLEEELTLAMQESEGWKIKWEEFGGKIWELEQENKNLKSLLEQKDEEGRGLHRGAEDLRAKCDDLEGTLIQEESLRKKSEERTNQLEQDKVVLDQALRESRRKYELLQEEHHKQQVLFEIQTVQGRQEIEGWKAKAEEMSQRIHLLEQEKGMLQHSLNERLEEVKAWNEKHQEMMKELDLAKVSGEQEKSLREKSEEHQKELEQAKGFLERMLRAEHEKYAGLQKEYQEAEAQWDKKFSVSNQELEVWKVKVEEMKEKAQGLEKSRIQLLQELEERSQRAHQWELKFAELEKTLKELQQSHGSLEKMLQANIKHLENQERELESSRRQIRELNVQLEQREVIQKRTLLASQLAEKEARLKALVQDQEKIEHEIREREETLRNVLAEQEKVEKELMEGKQAQRHYSEQAKKDKASRNRINNHQKDEGAASEISQEESQSLAND